MGILLMYPYIKRVVVIDSADALAYFAGITKMPFREFCLYGFLGALLRCIILVLAGSLILAILPWSF